MPCSKSRTSRRLVGAGLAVLATIVAVAGYLQVSNASVARGDAQAVPVVGSILQSGTVVGFASGANLNRKDPTRLDFDEIRNARNLDIRHEFEFEKHLLRIARVHEVRDVHPTAEENRILVGVVARIVGKRN